MFVQKCRELLEEHSKQGMPREVYVGSEFHPSLEAFIKKMALKAPMLIVTVHSVPFYVDPEIMPQGKKKKKVDPFRIVR